MKHSKEIEQSNEKECSCGCSSASKSSGGKKSCVRLKATRHVKKQKSVIDFLRVDIIIIFGQNCKYTLLSNRLF